MNSRWADAYEWGLLALVVGFVIVMGVAIAFVGPLACGVVK